MTEELLNELELTIDQWEALTEWQQYEKIRAVYNTASKTVWDANIAIDHCNEEILDREHEIEQAEGILKPSGLVVKRLRQALLIDPCPGQLPIEFPMPKKSRRKSA